jgi:arginase family enzyme
MNAEATYSLTTITVQNDEHECFEVWSDESKEITLGYLYNESDVDLLGQANNLLRETGLTPRQLAEQRAELLRALRLCAMELEELGPYLDERVFGTWESTREKAEAAIAKAKGRE